MCIYFVATLFSEFYLTIMSYFRNKSGMYDSLDFDFTECKSLAASTDEIIWSDDDTIVGDQETAWHEGKQSKTFPVAAAAQSRQNVSA